MENASLILSKAASADHFKRVQWRILLVAMFCYLFYYTGRQNFGFAIIHIQKDLQLSATDSGLISGLLLLTYGIGQAVSGILGDRFSPRHLVTIGAFSSILLNCVASFAIDFWTLLIPWALNGFAQSLGFAPGSRLLANWWPDKKRGFAFGCFLFSSGLSSVVTYGLCILVISHFSWPWLFRLPLIPFAIAACLFFIFVRNEPSEYGYQNQLAQPEKPSSSHANLNLKQVYQQLLTNRDYILACLSIGFNSLARYGLLIWMPVYYLNQTDDNGINSAWITLALPFGMAVGCIAAGDLSDKFFRQSRAHAVILFMCLASLFVLLLYVVPEQNSILSISLLFFSGFFIYGAQAPLFSLCPDIIDKQFTSTGIGLMNAAAYTFAALGEVLIGLVIDKSAGNIALMFIIVTLSCLFSMFSAFGVKK